MSKSKRPPAALDTEYCSTRDAADLLGVSIKTAQAWVESGVLQAWKTPGGHRRIRRESVDRLLSERHTDGTPPRTAQSAFTILAVDDDPRMRKLYELHLGKWDPRARLVIANSGFEALMHIGRAAPQILIAEPSMQGMDGVRMIRALRANPVLKALRIVVASSLSAAQIKDLGGLPEDIATFSKPVAFDELKQQLLELMAS